MKKHLNLILLFLLEVALIALAFSTQNLRYLGHDTKAWMFETVAVSLIFVPVTVALYGLFRKYSVSIAIDRRSLQ